MVSSPTQSGSVRSRSTAAKISAASSARPSASVSQQVSRHRASRLSESASRTSRMSPGLSSISRTAASSAISFEPRRKLHDREPEVLDASHHFDELREVNGLHDVAIGVQIVTLEDVVLGAGGGENDHRDPAQVGVGLHFTQNVALVFAR